MIAIPFFAAFFIIAWFSGKAADAILFACKEDSSPIFRLSFGGCCAILAGIISSIVSGIFALRVYASVGLYVLLLIALFVSSVILGRKNKVKTDHPKEKITFPGVLLISISALAVILQLYAVYSLRFEDPSVLKGVRVATAVFDTGRLFAADPMMLFIGSVSKALMVHPLKMIYTLLPPTLIVLYYLGYFAVLRCALKGNYVYVAFIAICALNLWGYQSKLLIPVTMLLSWFTLQAFIVHGIVPATVVILLGYFKNRPRRKIIQRFEEDEEEGLEEWDMKKHKIVNARNLAIALGVLAALLVIAVIVLNSKINRLYDATVNLQTDLDSRCSVYEFAPQSGLTEGYLSKGENGKITFVGGGGAENAEELAAFIQKFGTEIDIWYVYGEDEENSGAMRTLTSNGTVSVNKVYVINREEINTAK